MNYNNGNQYGNTPPDYNWQQPQFDYGKYYGQNDPFAEGPTGKSRGITALLAIFLGSLGIQYFYLGKTMPGIVFLLACICSCGTIPSLLSLIQGIVMLTQSNYDFTRKFVETTSSFPLF